MELEMKVGDLHECPDCASQKVVVNRDKDQLICRECGLIFEPPVIMETPEEPVFAAERRKASRGKKPSVKKKKK